MFDFKFTIASIILILTAGSVFASDDPFMDIVETIHSENQSCYELDGREIDVDKALGDFDIRDLVAQNDEPVFIRTIFAPFHDDFRVEGFEIYTKDRLKIDCIGNAIFLKKNGRLTLTPTELNGSATLIPATSAMGFTNNHPVSSEIKVDGKVTAEGEITFVFKADEKEASTVIKIK